MIIPWPAKITGFFDSSINFKALSIFEFSANLGGLYPKISISFSQNLLSKSNCSVNTSLGISINTGPGLPVFAIMNASFKTLGISSALITK